MQERLLDYLLGDLDERQRREVEAALLQDAGLRAELERLRSCLEAADPERTPCESRHEPPRGLAERTCAYIAGATDEPWLIASPPSRCREVAHRRPPQTNWSSTDLAVAAGVVLAMAMFFMPALQESRFLARRDQCQANLLHLAEAILKYAELHNGFVPDGTQFRGHFPVPSHSRSMAVSRVSGGDVPLLMVNENLLDTQTAFSSVVCPDSYLADQIRRRGSPLQVPSRQEYLAARQNGSDLHRRIGGSLAYRIGHFGPRGYQSWRLDGSPFSPLVSDGPGQAGPFLQSDNHRGIGMNVLFADGRIDFIAGCPTLAGGDKLFLNNSNARAPGVDSEDAVLIGGNETMEVIHRD